MKTTIAVLLVLTIVVLCIPGCNDQLENDSDSIGPSVQSGPESRSSAPPVHCVSSNFDRIVVVRLKHSTDLLDGLAKAVRDEGIKKAVILAGIGSLTSYHVHAVDNTTFPTKNVFFKAEGPQDLLNVNGYVIDGRVHAHITFADDEKALGGHLEQGTRVFTFAIITLGVLEEDTDLRRFDDWRW